MKKDGACNVHHLSLLIKSRKNETVAPIHIIVFIIRPVMRVIGLLCEGPLFFFGWCFYDRLVDRIEFAFHLLIGRFFLHFGEKVKRSE
ncbi:hypothetical protein, partial [Bacillus sp. JCM 19041]|uniref:hypothetical protein n=1 Tax=Bacillus sp. JCM 19041 TaxID=1460637 RepID=UPI003369D013